MNFSEETGDLASRLSDRLGACGGSAPLVWEFFVLDVEEIEWNARSVW